MTQKIQYVIVFIILAVVIIWTVYHLARKKKGGASPCCGCGLADSCKKKTLREQEDKMPVSCGDCPQTDDCSKKTDFLGCGGKSADKEKK